MQEQNSIYYQNSTRCVLLLHGYLGTAHELHRTARALNKADYSVYAINLAGHGTEDISDVFEIHPEEWISQIKEALIFLEKEGYKQIAIMGISLGGILALYFNTLMPNSFVCTGAFNAPFFGLSNSPIETYVKDGIRRILSFHKWDNREIEQKIEEITPKMNQQRQAIEVLTSTVRGRADNITGHVYIAKSEDDELIDPADQDALARQLVNAEVHLSSFPTGRHVITTGPMYKEFQTSLIQYLNSLNW